MSASDEERYWSERDFFGDLLKQLPLYVFWKNKDSVYLGCNDAFAHSLGLDSPQDIIGKTDYDLSTTQQESDFYRAIDKQVMATRQSRLNIEEQKTLPDGRKVTLLTNKVPLLDKQNNVVGVLGIYSDITERKNMQEELRRAKEKAKEANHGEIIFSSADILLQLLNDILEIIQTDEINKKNLHFESIDLEHLVSDLQQRVLPSIYAKKIDFMLEIHPDVPKFIFSDKLKIDRILLNIISNAIKFTEKGTINLKVAMGSKAKGESLIFTISDTGIGISGHELKEIFDLFYRSISSNEGKYEGYGIGLFTAKKYAERLKGTIQVSSKLKEGTTFTVEIPVEVKSPDIKLKVSETKEPCELDEAASAPGEKEGMINYKVLLIEDDALAQRTGTYFLQSEGFDVEIADTAELALKMVKSFQFDLIVSDIGLPGLSGNEFTILLRYSEKLGNKKLTPVVGLSAHSSDKLREESLLAGMNFVLTKPLNKQSLAKIKSLLGKSKSAGIKTPEKLGKDLPNSTPELFQLDNFPLLDKAQGMQATGGDSQLFQELLSVLIRITLPEESKALQAAYDKNDWNRLRKVAHKLKGACLYCGTTRLQLAAQYLERYLLAGHETLTSNLFTQLMTVIKQTQNYLADNNKELKTEILN